MRAIWLTIPAAVALVVALVFLDGRLTNTQADEQAVATPVTLVAPTSIVTVDPVATPSAPASPIAAETAVEIALSVATLKGDANPLLVSMLPMSISEAIAELSPGTELFGYDSNRAVFVVRFKGGPFEHVRSVPINRNPADFMTNGLFVVITVSDGDVIGTGAIRY